MKLWYGVLALALLAGGYGLYRVVINPAPGQKMPDMGQDHVSPQQVLETKYNSNPPTSGPHLPTWVKPGIYDTPQSEGELIHSLEHGYVIVSYNCGVHLQSKIKYQKSNIKNTFQKLNIIKQIYAHNEELESSQNGTPSASFNDSTIATGSGIIDTPLCKTLVKQLSDLARKKKLFKLIVVPRPQLDTTIALTAWTYIDKFDPDPIGVDTKRIEEFIDYHRDHGPEKTME